MPYQISHGCNSQPKHCCTHIRYLSTSVINPPHTSPHYTMHCHITPSPCPPTFPLDMFARVPVYIHYYVTFYMWDLQTCIYIKGILRHVSYFHFSHVHYAIPAVTGIYRHSTVLRYCRYMHLQYNTHFNPLLLSATHPPLLNEKVC